MSTFLRLARAEFIKLRRSRALHLVWILPLAFAVLDLLLYRRDLLAARHLTPDLCLTVIHAPLKAVAGVWSGYFHPLLLALLPALLVAPEHRARQWKHLHAQPVPRVQLYLVKALALLLLAALALLLAEIALAAEWKLLVALNPRLAFPFPWLSAGRAFAWMLLGSLPLLALYLWLAHRVDHPAVPVALGVVGVILAIALSRGGVNPPWKRDLIPWILPHVCTQQAIDDEATRQVVHIAGVAYRIQTPSERAQKLLNLPPEDLAWIIPPPSPTGHLVLFSLGAGIAVLGLGLLDTRRNRAT